MNVIDPYGDIPKRGDSMEVEDHLRIWEIVAIAKSVALNEAGAGNEPLTSHGFLTRLSVSRNRKHDRRRTACSDPERRTDHVRPYAMRVDDG